jgi:transposase
MVDTLENFGFLGVGCMRSIPSQYRWRLAKDWERPTKRAITTIIMHSDKTLLTKHKVVSQFKNQMIIEARSDLLKSNMV